MNKTELKDLVPPLDDCRAAYEAGVIGEGTALVHYVREYTQGCVIPRTDVRDEMLPFIIPAPTLVELLKELPNYNFSQRRRADGVVLYYISTPKTDDEVDTNPAAAALRLLVRVKQGGKRQ